MKNVQKRQSEINEETYKTNVTTKTKDRRTVKRKEIQTRRIQKLKPLLKK